MTLTSKIGFGPKASGEIAVLGKVGEILDTHHLNMDFAGKILILLTWVPREFLEKASFVGVAGVTVPSIHYRDYTYFQTHSDFTLLVLAKFGKLDLPEDLAEKMAKLSGKKGILDGEGKNITV